MRTPRDCVGNGALPILFRSWRWTRGVFHSHGLGTSLVVLIIIVAILFVPLVGASEGASWPTPSHVSLGTGPTEVTIPGGTGPLGVAFNPVNGYLYVADFGSSNVSVINTSTNQILTQIPLTYGIGTIAVDTATGFVYTASTYSTVYAINPFTNKVAATISVAAAGCPTGCAPEVQTYDAANGDIYVTDLATDYVSVIHNATVVATIPVGVSPNGAAYDSANGEIYVANEGSSPPDNLTVINGTTNTVVGQVSPISPGPGVAFDSDNGMIYVCSNAAQASQVNFVTAVNGTTNQVVASTRVVNICDGAVYDSQDGYVYMTNPFAPGSEAPLSNVTLFDPSTNQIVLTLPVQLAPYGIAYDSANHKVYVANLYSNTISILPPVYPVTFHETGLPSGANWSITMGGATVSSTNTTIRLPEPNGTTNFSVSDGAGLTASPSNGGVDVRGGPTDLNVTFSKGSGSGIFGLPGATGYFVLGGFVALLVAAVMVIVVLTRRKRRAKPSPTTPPPDGATGQNR